MMSNIITYWAGQENAPQVVFVNTRGSSHIAFSPFFFLFALCRITGIAMWGRRSLLHVNISNKGSAVRKFIIVTFGSLLRLRMVLHSHDGSLDCTYPYMPRVGRAAMRWMFGRGSRIVVLGEYWKSYFMKHLGVPADRIDVICNGVPAPSQRTAARASDETVRILYLGKLIATKGVADLLGALASERLGQLAWQATLAGDGDCEHYRRLADAHALKGRVAFPGWLDQPAVSRLLRDTDILVLPSYFEGLPMAVLEALAHSVAVVCTPVGALPDYLENHRSTLFVEPGNVAALAEAIELLITQPELRSRIAANGHNVFETHFDVAGTARKLQHVYAGLSEEHGQFRIADITKRW